MYMITVDYSATFHVDKYTDAYFSSEFIIFHFLHMFVLPDVASSGIVAGGLLPIAFFIPNVPS